MNYNLNLFFHQNMLLIMTNQKKDLFRSKDSEHGIEIAQLCKK